MPGTRLLTDSTVFQAAVAQINTTQVNLVAANMAAVTAAANNLAAINAAPAQAAAAAASAASAATAIASVPVGAATYIEGYGPPGANVGTSGATYYDLNTFYEYGPKTAAGWPAGEYVGARKSFSSTRQLYDFRVPGAVIPSNFISTTRNSTSTDMLPSDPYTYTYNTYAINTPIFRPGKGIIGGIKRAQQLLANPAAPVQETVTVPVGVVCITAWGPAGSQLVVASGATGGAVGTGFTTVSGTAGVASFITITTAGTITVTPSGGLTKANVCYNPSLPSGTEAAPFIPTQSIREADQIAMGSLLLSAFQSPQGYVAMYISDSTINNYSTSSTIFALNGVAAQLINGTSNTSVYDPGNHATNVSMGNGSFKTGAVIARTWDNTIGVSFGGGDTLEVSHPYLFNNGAAVTSGALFCKAASGNTAGDQMAFACLGFIEWDTAARLSDEALYSKYTSFILPQMSDIIKNLQGPQQFKKFLTAYRQCQAGIIDHVRVCDMGSSHHAGTGGTVNIRGNATTAQMVADMKLDGLYPVNDDCFAGMNTGTWTGGTNNFDGRVTYQNGTPTNVLNQAGVSVIRIPAGGQITFTPSLANARFRLAYYTGANYGQIQVSVDGGITPIASDEGSPASLPSVASTFTASVASGVLNVSSAVVGDPLKVGDYVSGPGIAASTIITAFLTGTGGAGTYSTTLASNVNTAGGACTGTNCNIRNYSAPKGTNNWTIKAVGTAIDIAWGYAYDPTGKQIVFGNFGTYAYTSPGLSLDASPEQSVQLPARRFAPHLSFGCSDDTNSYNTAITTTAWTTAVTSILTSLQLTADVILYTDPPTSVTVTPAVNQSVIYDCARAFAWQNNLPMFDFAAWAVGRERFPTGSYDDNIHIGKRMIKRTKSNPQKTLLYTILGYASPTLSPALTTAIGQLNTPQVNTVAASIAAINAINTNLAVVLAAGTNATAAATARDQSIAARDAAIAAAASANGNLKQYDGPPLVTFDDASGNNWARFLPDDCNYAPINRTGRYAAAALRGAPDPTLAAYRRIAERIGLCMSGESLSLGHGSGVAGQLIVSYLVSTVADMFGNAGLTKASIVPEDISAITNGTDPNLLANRAALTPALEAADTTNSWTVHNETPLSGCAQMIVQLLKDEDGIDFTGSGMRFLLTDDGRNGSPLSTEDATQTGYTAQRVYSSWAQGKALYGAQNKSFVPAVNMFMIGTNDNAADAANYPGGANSKYFYNLAETIRAQRQAQAATLFGSTYKLPMMIGQTATHLNPTYFTAIPHVALDQLQLAIDKTDWLLPVIQYACENQPADVHLTGPGSKLAGAYFGWHIKRLLFDGIRMAPLLPTFKAMGKQIIATFPVGRGHKILGGQTVADTTVLSHWGVTAVAADGVTAKVLSNPRVVSRDTIIWDAPEVPADVWKFRSGYVGNTNKGWTNIVEVRDGLPLTFDPDYLRLMVGRWYPIAEIPLS